MAYIQKTTSDYYQIEIQVLSWSDKQKVAIGVAETQALTPQAECQNTTNGTQHSTTK